MSELFNQWQGYFTDSHSLTADWIVVGIFAAAFAILGIVARNVWGGLRRPVGQDQDEPAWLDDVPPWSLRTDRLRKGMETVGSENGAVGLPNSVLHGGQQ